MRIPGVVAETPPGGPAHESTLSADVFVSGTISGQDLAVLGRFEGELRLAGLLRTGGSSQVKAVVNARAVEIEGEFEGEVRAQSLRLTPTARARGTFVADRLVVEEGAVVHGAVNRELTVPAPAEVEAPVAAETELQSETPSETQSSSSPSSAAV